MVATATMKKNEAATFSATIATFFKYGIAALPIYPAAKINWDAGIAQHDITLALVGIGFAVGGAICIENAVHSLSERRIASAGGWGGVGLILLLLSFMNALGNFAGNSDHSRDVRSSQQTAAGTTSSQRSQLVDRRKAQVAIVAKPFSATLKIPGEAEIPGEASAASIEAKIQAYKAHGMRLWNSSNECKNPTWQGERDFCSGVSELQGKKDAAIERDKIQGKIDKIDDAPKDVAAQSNVISFADSVADMIVLLGYDLKDKDGKDDRAKLLISRIYDWGRALGVEILAFFLPAGILQLFARGGVPKRSEAPQPQPQTQRKTEKAIKAMVAPIVAESPKSPPATIPAIVATSQKVAEIDAFRASCLEENIPAAKARSTPVFEAWKQYCASHGIEPGSQKAFCDRIQARGIGYDRNNGRPIYLNVQLKPAESRSQGRAEHGGLRLAVNNA